MMFRLKISNPIASSLKPTSWLPNGSTAPKPTSTYDNHLTMGTNKAIGEPPKSCVVTKFKYIFTLGILGM
jgi:hypothetical protein